MMSLPQDLNDTHFEDKLIVGQVIALDDHFFFRCEFRDCKLMYSGGQFSLEQSVVGQGCEIEFLGAAKRTILVLEKLRILKGDEIASDYLGSDPDQ